jgi:hypothetical protein
MPIFSSFTDQRPSQCEIASGTGCDLPFGQDRAVGIGDADRRLFLRNVQSCEHANVILRRIGVGTDGEGRRRASINRRLRLRERRPGRLR